MKQKMYTFLAILAIAFTSTMTANAQCQANYTIWQDTSFMAAPHTYNGSNTSIGGFMAGIDTVNYTYTWTWGDGSSSVGPFPSHTYAVTGNYTICIIMNSINPAGGCNDTTCLAQTINKNRAMATVNILNPFATPTSTQNVSTLSNEVYPNPANDKLYFIGLAATSHAVAVFSVDGKLQFNTTINGNDALNISGLSNGTYFVQVQAPQQARKVFTFSKK
jgi:hypothetical protein